MKIHHIKILISIIITFSAIGSAHPSDSVRARLKSGARIRGILQSSNSSSVTIDVDGIGATKFDWSDITYLSSPAVYDSLVGEKALVVLPSPEFSRREFGKMVSANIFFGYAVQHERGFGFGGQAQFAMDRFSGGLIGVLHFGSSSNGNTTFTYWGPHVGGIISFGDFTIKPSLSYGQASYTTMAGFNAAGVTTSCFSPGLSIHADLGFTKIGLQYKYFSAKNNTFSGLYLLIGQ